MLKILGKAIATLATSALLFAGGMSAAFAVDPACDPALSATGCQDNVTCQYERWAAPDCNEPWTVSIAQECKQLWAENNAWVKTDPVCKAYQPKAKVVKVKKGQTLWRVAVICYGHKYAYPEKAGHKWRYLAKKNGVKGKTIYVGQRLTC
jgi:hypothetical protein